MTQLRPKFSQAASSSPSFIDAQELKLLVKLENVIGQTYELIGSGRWLRLRDHDSCVIDTQTQRFFWNSRNLYGDVYVWLMALYNWDFAEAKAYVARVVGIGVEENGPQSVPRSIEQPKPQPRKLMPPSPTWRRKGREVVAKAEAYLWNK
jgi:hypothetical protein